MSFAREGVFRDERKLLDGLRNACVEGAAKMVEVSILRDLRNAAAVAWY